MTLQEALGMFLAWWACSLALALAAWPVVFLCLKRLPERGLAFARIFGLLGVGYLFWLGCWLHLWQNTSGAIWLAAVIVFAAGTALVLRQKENPWTWLREHWKEALFTEGLFLAMFALWAWVRANNPSGEWPEKPMELAFINAIMRSSYFPPNDPWLSGYAISYYHFGYILTAMLAEIAAVKGSVAHILSTSMIFGLAGVGSFGLLRNVLLLRQNPREDPPQSKSNASSAVPWRKTPGGLGSRQFLFLSLLAPFTLLIVGNLEGFLEILHSEHVGWQDGQGFFWKWLDVTDLSDPPSGPAQFMPDRSLWWWRASRVVHDQTLKGEPLELIDEFPAFSFMLGDLHPHVLALPFLLAALGVVLEILLRGGGAETEPKEERWLFLFFCALSIGSLVFLNTWDILVFGMAAIAGWVGWKLSRKEIFFGPFSGWKAYLARWATTGAAALGLFLPFFIGFSSQAGGLIPNVLFPTQGTQYLVMFGTLLVPILGWILLEATAHKDTADWGRSLFWVGVGLAALLVASLIAAFVISLNPDIIQMVFSYIDGTSPMEAVSGQFLRRLADPLASLLPAGLITVALALILGWIRKEQPAGKRAAPRDARAPQERIAFVFMLILAAWGALIVLIPEYFYLRDVFGYRINTIFKFYFQGWTFWSLAAAYGAVRLLQTVQERESQANTRWGFAVFGSIFVLVVFLCGAVYLPMSVWTTTNGFHPNGGPTLDASAYLQWGHPEDTAAIEWIRANITDNGPLVEATGDPYSYFGRVATFTGIPNLLGWANHESQWRGGYREMGDRALDISNLYQTTDWERADGILAQYNIRYVYYGPLEKQTYGQQGLRKFLAHLKVIYQTEDVVIFERVIP